MPRDQRPAENAQGSAPADQIGMPSLVALRGAESLRRLRDRITKAVDELGRLREENRKLEERILELERGPVWDVDETLVKISDTPEHLRKRMDTFIAAIDTYLAKNEA